MKLNTNFVRIGAFTALLLVAAAILLVGCAPRIVIDPMDMVVRVPSSSSTSSVAVPSGTADIVARDILSAKGQNVQRQVTKG